MWCVCIFVSATMPLVTFIHLRSEAVDLRSERVDLRFEGVDLRSEVVDLLCNEVGLRLKAWI
jgi:hypothetical protein